MSSTPYHRFDEDNMGIRSRIRAVDDIHARIDEDMKAVEKIIGPAKEEE